MARAALGWSAAQLAASAGVGEATVRRFERGQGNPIPAIVQAIRAALEAGGITFIDANGEGPGVRLRRDPGRSD
jgi:transcriptional regulator with XRE-family HTH domain